MLKDGGLCGYSIFGVDEDDPRRPLLDPLLTLLKQHARPKPEGFKHEGFNWIPREVQHVIDAAIEQIPLA